LQKSRQKFRGERRRFSAIRAAVFGPLVIVSVGEAGTSFFVTPAGVACRFFFAMSSIIERFQKPALVVPGKIYCVQEYTYEEEHKSPISSMVSRSNS
jgi:hypothetical protein